MGPINELYFGHIVVPPTMGTKWYECIKAGQSSTVVPFDNANDEAGDIITDYQVQWLCRGDGGVGNAKFTYSTHEFVLCGEELEVGYTYGNPNMVLTRRSGTKTGPRARVVYIGEEILQISGTLRGPGTPADIATLQNVFKNRFNSATITLALTGDNATKFGSSLTVMHSGSNSVRVKPLRGTRYLHRVDIQVIVVDNS